MTPVKKLILLIFIVAGITSKSYAQVPDPSFHIYILLGQSNMSGRGPITEKFKDEINMRVYMLNHVNEWVLAKHPLHFDKPSAAGVGPGLAFGIKMAEASGPNIRIGLIPCAVGGTSIENWYADAYDTATGTHPYNDAVARIRAAMRSGVIKGIIWHQGESNSEPGQIKKYLGQLTELIQRFRKVTDDPTLPFIVGELGRYRQSYAGINYELNKLVSQIPYTALASSEGLTHKGDSLHFDSNSAEELGRRYAVKMLAVQRGSRSRKLAGTGDSVKRKG